MSTQRLPLLPLRDTVIFPGMVAPIFVGREISIAALEESQHAEQDQFILISAQVKHDVNEPTEDDIYDIGVRAKIMQIIVLPNNCAKILVEAIDRVRLTNISGKKFLSADYTRIEETGIGETEELLTLVDKAVDHFKHYVAHNRKITPEVLKAVNDEKNPIYLLNIMSSHLTCSVARKQSLLNESDMHLRTDLLVSTIEDETNIVQTEQLLQQKVKQQMDKTQRDYYLNEQMKAIQKELGDEEVGTEFYELDKKMKSTKLSKEAREKANAEFKKLKSMNQMSAESAVVKNYLETMLALPWSKFDRTKIDVKKAEEILNRDHFGLEKVKERIIEYLAVLKRSDKVPGPILCLVGPPGVGKTSLVKSIAEATGRQYAKFSLGGVRDESEIRGHRRTYLGSMPGKIITLLKKVKTSNPVMLLDEIDKMGSDFRGDPASAMLEVLDPEQNKSFVDHYLEVEFDISNVLFIATANTYNLPRALIDRMEVINISGYIEEEKVQIAKKYLIMKQRKMHGIKEGEIIITDATILELIRYYTKESGVRSLEREIGALMRKGLKQILSDKTGGLTSLEITPEKVEKYLGIKKYRYGLSETDDQIGATTGLAYTEVGGDLLTIEAVFFPGKGEIKTTGKLGDVMKESAAAAYSCFRTNADSLGLKYENYKDMDIHLHVPEGAVPKDGPSAGIAIYTTIVSLMTNRAVKKSVAMTGEITLRGRVLPIGGLKEKLLAATRGGIKTVLIPFENIKDLQDIPEEIKRNLEIIPVKHVDQVLQHALV